MRHNHINNTAAESTGDTSMLDKRLEVLQKKAEHLKIEIQHTLYHVTAFHLTNTVFFLTTIEGLQNGIDVEKEVKTIEILLIKRALEASGGNQRIAARLLKLKCTTLNAKIKRYKIEFGELPKRVRCKLP